MRNRLTCLASATLAAAMLAACGGSGPGASALPSVPPVNVPSGLIPSFAIPSFAIPSFGSDPTIEAAFPAQIDGKPLTGITSANFLAVVQSFSTPEQVQAFVSGMQSINVNPATVGFGSANATVDDNPVQLQLVRFPGGDARVALDILVRIDQPETPPQITTETIGGKSVTVATTDGDREYYYVNGEWAWFLPDAEQSEAEVIFAALP
jgi:hypothetical protein